MPGIVRRGSKPGSPPHVRSILCTPCEMLLPLASNTINQCGGTHRTQFRRPGEPNKQRQIVRPSRVQSVLFVQHTRFPQPQCVPVVLRLCTTHNAQNVDTGQALADRARNQGKEEKEKKNLNLSEEKRCSRTWNSHHTRGSAVVQISRVWDTQTSCPVWHQQPGSKSLQSTSFPTLMLTMNSTKGSSTQLNA